MVDGQVWEQAQCRNFSPAQADTLFFTPELEEHAKQVCRGCPALVECFRIGEKFPLGVFGGASPDERHTQR